MYAKISRFWVNTREILQKRLQRFGLQPNFQGFYPTFHSQIISRFFGSQKLSGGHIVIRFLFSTQGLYRAFFLKIDTLHAPNTILKTGIFGLFFKFARQIVIKTSIFMQK